MGLFDSLFGGGDKAQPATQDILKILESIAQATSNVAGPGYNLYNAISGPYGQTGLSNKWQEMFGYTNSPGGGYSLNTPAGGWLGLSQSGPTIGGGAPVVGPSQGSSYIGGNQVIGTNGTVSAAGSGATGDYLSPSTLPGPAEGSKIGFGQTFSDPYANYPAPAQSPGAHPGTLSLNTTALNSYGPLATGSLLNANPFLADALVAQNANLYNALNTSLDSPLLGKLNQSAAGLNFSGALTPQQIRDQQQATGAYFGANNIGQGNSAMAADLFGRQSAMNAEQDRAYQLASGVQGLNFQQQGLGLQQQGLLGNLASQAAGTASSSITNPIMQLLFGFPQPGTSAGENINAQNALTGASDAAGLGIAGFNANAASAANIANANSSASGANNFWQALFGLGGAALGAGG